MRSPSIRSKYVHTLINSLIATTFLTGGLMYSQTSTPQTTKDSATQTVPAPDNTATNKQDRDQASPTADQQKENTSDRKKTQAIRRAIMQDKSLSMYAHNVKVIVQDGKVTLKGPVRSEEEKAAIASKATETAGDANVDNQLTVAPPK
jgi:hyperosmotically inducible periplasmic protein